MPRADPPSYLDRTNGRWIQAGRCLGRVLEEVVGTYRVDGPICRHFMFTAALRSDSELNRAFRPIMKRSIARVGRSSALGSYWRHSAVRTRVLVIHI